MTWARKRERRRPQPSTPVPALCAYGHLHAMVNDARAVSWRCGDQPSLAGLLFHERFLIRFHGEMNLREVDLCWGFIDTDQQVDDARGPWVRKAAARLAPLCPCGR